MTVEEAKVILDAEAVFEARKAEQAAELEVLDLTDQLKAAKKRLEQASAYLGRIIDEARNPSLFHKGADWSPVRTDCTEAPTADAEFPGETLTYADLGATAEECQAARLDDKALERISLGKVVKAKATVQLVSTDTEYVSVAWPDCEHLLLPLLTESEWELEKASLPSDPGNSWHGGRVSVGGSEYRIGRLAEAIRIQLSAGA